MLRATTWAFVSPGIYDPLRFVLLPFAGFAEGDFVTGWNPLCPIRALAWIMSLALGLGLTPASAQEASSPPPTPPANQVRPQAIVERVATVPPTLPAVPCASAPGLGPEMIVIEAGRFVMGSPANEPGRFEQEGPQREIVVVRPFAIARCETTVAEFRAFVEATGHVAGDGCYVVNEAGTEWTRQKERSWRNPGFPQTDAHPVVCVSWNDAVAYAEWLSRRTGQTYRLPTEAEWEYAARAGSRSRYPAGDHPDVLLKSANTFDRESALRWPRWREQAGQGSDGHPFTAPVGSYQPNAFGLHDMIGNVWEWVADWYGEDYYARSPGVDPQGPATGTVRVRRGGSWHSWPLYSRVAFRNWNTPETRYVLVGFRLLREAPPAAHR